MTDQNPPNPDSSTKSAVERLEAGVSDLHVAEPAADMERALVRIGMALPIVGLVIIGVAWYGASGTGYVSKQIPYLISGGLVGLGLLLIGLGLFLRYSVSHLLRFGIARMVHEHQAQADRIIEAIGGLEQAMSGRSHNSSIPGNGPGSSAEDRTPASSA